MNEDNALARDFVEILLGDDQLDGTRQCSFEISVKTQVPEGGNCVDMVITVCSRRIGVENKLDSPEGRGQLRRYLATPLDRLAYVTPAIREVDEAVILDAHYLRPEGKNHFCWSDFYDVIARRANDASILTEALLTLFKDLGFDPPHEEIGDLQNQENRENFSKLWRATKVMLRRRGWKRLDSGSTAEMYVKNGTSESVEQLWCDPRWTGNNLRLRVTLKDPRKTEDVANYLKQKLEFRGVRPLINRAESRRARGKIQVVDVVITFDNLFARIESHEEIETRLAEFVIHVLDEVHVGACKSGGS